jgi:hypothetical protein
MRKIDVGCLVVFGVLLGFAVVVFVMAMAL